MRILPAALGLLLATLFFSTTATALSFQAESFRDDRHSVWVPGLDQRHLHFDDHAVFEIQDDQWSLEGDLVSGTDDSNWSIDVTFQNILSGDEFGVLTGFDDGRIKGTDWANQRDDWMFASTVTGTLTAHDGEWAGHTFEIVRMPGTGDYWAQLGTCLNDKNCEYGLSSWITLTDVDTKETYRGDININLSNPVPEPSAALVFGLGTLVAGSFVERRRR
ncbi:MAG: hypothetical protein AAGC67_16900 [Myxococcota bacterium]